jgi:hypothetical protein
MTENGVMWNKLPATDGVVGVEEDVREIFEVPPFLLQSDSILRAAIKRLSSRSDFNPLKVGVE